MNLKIYKIHKKYRIIIYMGQMRTCDEFGSKVVCLIDRQKTQTQTLTFIGRKVCGRELKH